MVETLYCTYSLKLNISINIYWIEKPLVCSMYHWKADTPLQAAPSKEPGRIGVQHEAVLEAVLEAACQENRSPPGYPLKYFCHNFLNISLFLIILVIF